MNITVLVCLATCVAGASAQEKPRAGTPAPAVPPLATSKQGESKTAVDIVVALRHMPPGVGKCDKGGGACDVAEHWLVELQPAGGKPVLLTLHQQSELQKELKSAASPKARKVESVTLSDATVSLRVPPNTPYANVQSLLTTVASAGIHRTEFAVASADQAIEQRLAVPLPTPSGAEASTDPAPPGEEVRVALFWDKAKGEVIRKFGNTVLRKGAIGETQTVELIQDSMEGWRRLGKPDTPGVIDAAGAVPWQAVVQVIDAFRAARVKNIQFAAGRK